MTLVCTNNFIL